MQHVAAVAATCRCCSYRIERERHELDAACCSCCSYLPLLLLQHTCRCCSYRIERETHELDAASETASFRIRNRVFSHPKPGHTHTSTCRSKTAAAAAKPPLLQHTCRYYCSCCSYLPLLQLPATVAAYLPLLQLLQLPAAVAATCRCCSRPAAAKPPVLRHNSDLKAP